MPSSRAAPGAAPIWASCALTTPDILEFIQCKADTSEITNFNISVALTEEFMEAVLAGETYQLINPRNKEAVGELPAAEVFDLIVKWHGKTGNPALCS